MRETVQLPAIPDDDATEKRAAIQSSFLGRLLQQEQDELARSQQSIEKMLLKIKGHEGKEQPHE